MTTVTACRRSSSCPSLPVLLPVGTLMPIPVSGSCLGFLSRAPVSGFHHPRENQKSREANDSLSQWAGKFNRLSIPTLRLIHRASPVTGLVEPLQLPFQKHEIPRERYICN